MNAAQAALAEMDVDNDGRISYPEYLLALKFKINKWKKFWNNQLLYKTYVRIYFTI